MVATGLEVEEASPVREKNGFALFDIDPEAATVRLFEWRRGEPEEEIDRGMPITRTSSDGPDGPPGSKPGRLRSAGTLLPQSRSYECPGSK